MKSKNKADKKSFLNVVKDFQKIEGKFLRHPPMFTPEFYDWKMKHGMWVPSRYRKGRKTKK